MEFFHALFPNISSREILFPNRFARPRSAPELLLTPSRRIAILPARQERIPGTLSSTGGLGDKEIIVINSQRLVVVDGVPETAQVLRAVFEPRGHRVDRIRAFELEQFAQDPSNLLVLHQEDVHPAPASPPIPSPPRVIIGSLAADDARDRTPSAPRLQQPFHYAELIRAVESLLNENPVRKAA